MRQAHKACLRAYPRLLMEPFAAARGKCLCISMNQEINERQQTWYAPVSRSPLVEQNVFCPTWLST
jgi:hypothetical protein